MVRPFNISSTWNASIEQTWAHWAFEAKPWRICIWICMSRRHTAVMMSWRKGATLTGTSTPSPILPHCPRSHLSLYFFVTLYLYLSCTSFFVFFLYLDKDRFYLSIIFDRSRSRCVEPLQQSTFPSPLHFPRWELSSFPPFVRDKCREETSLVNCARLAAFVSNLRCSPVRRTCSTSVECAKPVLGEM